MTPASKTEDNLPVTTKTDLRELFPVLHLLRASGLAIDPRKMFLGGLALILLSAGDWTIAELPFASMSHWDQYSHDRNATFTLDELLGCAGFLPRPTLHSWLSWEAVAFSLLTPVRSLIEPARAIFQTNQSWSSLAVAWTQLLWALVVWSLIGGALCRMNALQFAARKRLGVIAALKFSRRQLLGYLVAPCLPLSAVLILQSFNWLLGYLASLWPVVGDVVLGIGWGLVLFCGFLMAMLVLGIAVGWPLMIAAVSAEDSDGFDGLSRAFGYLFDRPWLAVIFAVSSLPVFAASRLLVGILVGLTVLLGTNAISRGYQADPVDSYFDSRVEPGYAVDHESLAGNFAERINAALTGGGSFPLPDGMPAVALAAWTLIPALLYAGFGPSFFWSATTVSYFLLRQSDDGTPLDSVVNWPKKVDPETPPTSDVREPESLPDGS